MNKYKYNRFPPKEPEEKGETIISFVLELIGAASLVFVALPMQWLTLVSFSLAALIFWRVEKARKNGKIFVITSFFLFVILHTIYSQIRRDTVYSFQCSSISMECVFPRTEKIWGRDITLMPIFSPLRLAFDNFIQLNNEHSFFLDTTSRGGDRFFIAPQEQLFFVGLETSAGMKYVDLDTVRTSAVLDQDRNVFVAPRVESTVFVRRPGGDYPGLFAVAIDDSAIGESARRAAFSNELARILISGERRSLAAPLWREYERTNRLDDLARYGVFALLELNDHAPVTVSNNAFGLFVRDMAAALQSPDSANTSDNWIDTFTLNLARSSCFHAKMANSTGFVQYANYVDPQGCRTSFTAEFASRNFILTGIRDLAKQYGRFSTSYTDAFNSLLDTTTAMQSSRDFDIDTQAMKQIRKDPTRLLGGSAFISYDYRIKAIRNLYDAAREQRWRLAANVAGKGFGDDKSNIDKNCIGAQFFWGADQVNTSAGKIRQRDLQAAIATVASASDRATLEQGVTNADADQAAAFFGLADKRGVVCTNALKGGLQWEAARALFEGSFGSLAWKLAGERKLLPKNMITIMQRRAPNFDDGAYRYDLYVLVAAMQALAASATDPAGASSSLSSACSLIGSISDAFVERDRRGDGVAIHASRPIENSLLIGFRLCGDDRVSYYERALSRRRDYWTLSF